MHKNVALRYNLSIMMLLLLCACSSSVRVVSSERSGMGKSLYIRRMAEQLETVTKAELKDCRVVIPIHGPVVTPDVVLKFLKDHYRKNKCMIYHFDIAPSVRTVMADMLVWYKFYEHILCFRSCLRLTQSCLAC